MTGQKVLPEEVSVLMAMDDAFLAAVGKELEAQRERIRQEQERKNTRRR